VNQTISPQRVSADMREPSQNDERGPRPSGMFPIPATPFNDGKIKKGLSPLHKE
jgi:hypothetical protein